MSGTVVRLQSLFKRVLIGSGSPDGSVVGRASVPQAGRSTPDYLTFAQELATRLPALLVEAQHIAHVISQGAHGRRRAGVGDHFWQYRPAVPGEPVNRIDWRQSARSTHAWVKENEAQSAQTLSIWCDTSASMFWRSDDQLPYKIDRAIVCVLALSELLLRAGERVRIINTDSAVVFSTRHALPRIAQTLLHQITKAADNRLFSAAQATGTYGRLVLVSDFLWDPTTTAATLQSLSALPLQTHLLQIIDPAEVELPYSGRIRFDGLEDETSLILSDVRGLQDRYKAAFAGHEQALQSACDHTGAAMTRHITNKPAQTTLLTLHHHLTTSPRRSA